MRSQTARRCRREEAMRSKQIRWRKIGEWMFFETPLCAIVVILLIVPIAVWDAWIRLTIREGK